jgi:hypothetical protein
MFKKAAKVVAAIWAGIALAWFGAALVIVVWMLGLDDEEPEMDDWLV